MRRYFIVSIGTGVLFGILDGLINANPLATKLYEAYRPLAKVAINYQAGIIIDLIYGFILAGLFLLLYRSLPGRSGAAKGLSFALLVWFFRVAMGVASSWMMFNIPLEALLYTLVSGLTEMIILGMVYGLTLKPDK